jgi:hypothetical protein
MARVGPQTLSKIFGISEQHVNNLIKDHTLKQEPDGKLELGPAVYSYIQRIKLSKNVAPEGSARATEEEEKAIKARISRELAEINLERAKRKLYRADDVNAYVANMIMVVRARMLGIPSKIAPLLIGADDYHQIETLIKSEVIEALAELAAYTPPPMDGEEVDEDGIFMGEERN